MVNIPVVTIVPPVSADKSTPHSDIKSGNRPIGYEPPKVGFVSLVVTSDYLFLLCSAGPRSSTPIGGLADTSVTEWFLENVGELSPMAAPLPWDIDDDYSLDDFFGMVLHSTSIEALPPTLSFDDTLLDSELELYGRENDDISLLPLDNHWFDLRRHLPDWDWSEFDLNTASSLAGQSDLATSDLWNNSLES